MTVIASNPLTSFLSKTFDKAGSWMAETWVESHELEDVDEHKRMLTIALNIKAVVYDVATIALIQAVAMSIFAIIAGTFTPLNILLLAVLVSTQKAADDVSTVTQKHSTLGTTQRLVAKAADSTGVLAAGADLVTTLAAHTIIPKDPEPALSIGGYTVIKGWFVIC